MPGVGEKTATALVTRFGSVEEIITAAEAGGDGFPAGAAARVLGARAYLSAAVDVVRGRIDVPLEDIEDGLPTQPNDATRLVELADEYGLDSSINRVLAAIKTALS